MGQTDNFIEPTSVVLRYAEHMREIELRWLERATIQEGMEVIRGSEYKGVGLSLLDLSTHAATGSFKSSVACVTMAACLQRGLRRFVTQSSGNTANALAKYAAAAGIQVMILYPATSIYKIEPELTKSEFVQMVEVEGSEADLKRLTREYATVMSLPWLPNDVMQVESNKLRAYFVTECEAKNNIFFDWHAQALSSAWGIFGFYKGIDELRSNGLSTPYPHLLGVQQEAVCPFYNYLSSTRSDQSILDMIEPTLFRSNPSQEMLESMKSIVERSSGQIVMLPNLDYERYQDLALETISDFGIRLGKVQLNGKQVFKEKAGILAMAAVLRAIDKGQIPKGDNVLVCLTGGSGLDRTTLFQPEYRIQPTGGLDALLKIGNQFFTI